MKKSFVSLIYLCFLVWFATGALKFYPCNLSSLLFKGKNTSVLTGCTFRSNQPNILQTYDGGENWKTLNQDKVSENMIWLEFVSDELNQKIVGISGLEVKQFDAEYYILKSNNGGNSWSDVTPIQTPMRRGFFQYVQSDLKGQHLAVLCKPYSSAFIGELYISKTSGHTWERKTNLPDVYQIHLQTVNHTWPILYATTMQGIYRSENFAQTWTWLHPLAASAITVDISGNHLWIMNYQSIWYSSDHGSTWISKTIPAIKHSFYPTIQSHPIHPHLVTITFFDANLTFQVYHTNTTGKDWLHQSTLPVYYHMQPPLVQISTDTKELLIGLPDYPLLYSDDYGQSFTTMLLSHSRAPIIQHNLPSGHVKAAKAPAEVADDDYHAREHRKYTNYALAQDGPYTLLVMQYYDNTEMRYWYVSTDFGENFHPLLDIPPLPIYKPGYVSHITKISLVTATDRGVAEEAENEEVKGRKSNGIRMKLTVQVRSNEPLLYTLEMIYPSSMSSVTSSFEWIRLDDKEKNSLPYNSQEDDEEEEETESDI